MARPKDRVRVKSAKARKCAICGSRQPGTVEIYQFRDELDVYLFRNDTAKQLAADGRNPAPIAAESLLHLLGMNYFDEAHLGHVDTAQPGICTRRFGGLILLDGIHRAVRCLAEKRPFLVYELSYEESLVCLVQQQVSAQDAETIARKLRQSLEYFPRSSSLDTPIECSPEMLEQAARLFSAQELKKFNLRAVPVPE
jgi:hypothetical protein